MLSASSVASPFLLLLLLLVLLLLLLLASDADAQLLPVGPARCFLFFFQLSCESCMVMDDVQNPQKSSGYDQGTTMRKNISVVTPRCAAAAVVSAVVLRRPKKEYTHRYSMMHRRMTTAGIEVASFTTKYYYQ